MNLINRDLDQEEYDHVIKVVFIGDSGVGKTNILSRFCRNEFMADSKSTIGVEFASKILQVEGRKIKVQIWDTAGQERFKSITNTYYYRAQGAFVVYDITKNISFENVDKWIEQLRQYAGAEVSVILVGNKSDLKSLRAVTKQDGVEKANLLGDIGFLETSALNNTNIDEAFKLLVTSNYFSF
jgi:Ras-related protein Rab-11A